MVHCTLLRETAVVSRPLQVDKMEVERSSIMTHSGKYIIFFHVTYPMSELAELWIHFLVHVDVTWLGKTPHIVR